MVTTAALPPSSQDFLATWYQHHYRDCKLEVDQPERREWMRLELGGLVRRPLWYDSCAEAVSEAAVLPPNGLFANVAVEREGPSPSGSTPRIRADVALDADCKAGPLPDGDGFQDLSDAFLAARRHILDAREALQRDFALCDDEGLLRFSGGKGYHLLLVSERFRGLDKRGREELLACLKGANTQLALIFPGMGGLQLPLARPEGGAPRRIWDNLAALQRACKSPFPAARLQQLLVHHAAALGPDKVLQTLKGTRTMSQVFQEHPKWWDSLVACSSHLAGPLLDGGVLMDVRRMIRVAGSINGKTGLLCHSLTFDQLDGFDPFTDANPYPRSGAIPLIGLDTASVTTHGETFRLQADQRVEFPPCAAVPLVAQRLARPLP